jgi:HK97 family phage prohead protease
MRTERSIPVTAKMEFRSTSTGHHFTGYAAVFGQESSPLPYTETVHPGAFIRSLAAPPNGRQTLVVDHDDSKLLASTRTDRLHLSEDSTGLLAEGDMVDTTYARDVRELSDADELAGMSFEFTATKGGAPFSSDGKRRNLKEVRLYHVTVLTGKTPAYATTTAAVRALANGAGAEYEDVSALFDAVREGRKLDADEFELLERVITPILPADSRWSAAASDASSASYAFASVMSLIGNEMDDPEQMGLLKTAADALQAFIAAESAEIGTDADKAASGVAYAYRSNAQALIDAAKATAAH